MIYHNLLTPEECRHLRRLAAPQVSVKGMQLRYASSAPAVATVCSSLSVPNHLAALPSPPSLLPHPLSSALRVHDCTFQRPLRVHADEALDHGWRNRHLCLLSLTLP